MNGRNGLPQYVVIDFTIKCLRINTTSPIVFSPSSLGPPPTRKPGISTLLLPAIASSAVRQKRMLRRQIRMLPKLLPKLSPWPTAVSSNGSVLDASGNFSVNCFTYTSTILVVRDPVPLKFPLGSVLILSAQLPVTCFCGRNHTLLQD
jgi:hypothetical protein